MQRDSLLFHNKGCPVAGLVGFSVQYVLAHLRGWLSSSGELVGGTNGLLAMIGGAKDEVAVRARSDTTAMAVLAGWWTGDFVLSVGGEVG